MAYWRGREHAEFDVMKSFGVGLLRRPLNPKNDYSGEIDLDSFKEDLELCRKYGFRLLVTVMGVPDIVAEEHPLTGVDGTKYARGHMRIYNFFDPVVQDVAKKVAWNCAKIAKENADVISYLQFMNEWVMQAYVTPYSLVMGQYSTPICFDEHAKKAWLKYLGTLPEAWKKKILEENSILRLEDVPMATEYPKVEFSPTYIAWCQFQSYSMGKHFRDLYQTVKEVYAEGKVVSHACMPALNNGFPTSTKKEDESAWKSSWGHDVEFWLEAGRCFDILCVNTYNNYFGGWDLFGVIEYPYIQDNDVTQLQHYSRFHDVVRAHRLDGLMISEIGANSFFHSEDGQRYLVMRQLIEAMAYSQPETINVHCWTDDATLSPHREQFFGLVREKLRLQDHRELKPAFYGWYLAKRTIDKVNPFQYPPFTYVILSRQLMQMGLAPTAEFDQIPIRCSKPARPRPLPRSYARLVPHVLACRDVNLRVSTDQLVAKYGFNRRAKSIIVFDSAEVSSPGFIQRLIEFDGPIFTSATIGFYGLDDDEERKSKVLKLTGLKRLRYETRDVLKIEIVEAVGFFKQGKTFEFPYGKRLATIRKEDLPVEAELLAQFQDGCVAIYQYRTRYISAFTLDVKDYELVAPLTYMLTKTIARASETWLSIKNKKPDPYLYVYPMGNLTSVVNGDIADKIAKLQTPIGTVELPVRGKDTSCFNIEDGKLTFAIITAKGSLRLNGKALITAPDGINAIYDSGSLEVRPYYSEGGYQILRVLANGEQLERDDDELTPKFVGKKTLPLKIELITTPRVDAKMDLVQNEIIANGVGDEFSQEVTVLTKPDMYRFILQIRDVLTNRVKVRAYKFIPEQALWKTIGEWVMNKEKKYLEAEMKVDHLEKIRIEAIPVDQAGKRLKGRIQLKFEMLYENRVIPSMSYLIGDYVHVRMLYPYRYEACKITGTKAKIFSQGKGEPFETRTLRYWLQGVTMGSNGQHWNHLYRSEFKCVSLP